MMKIASVLVFVLLSSSAHADERTLRNVFRAAAVGAIAAHGADAFTTARCLGLSEQAVHDGKPPICRETNPYLGRLNNPVAFGATQLGIAGVSTWLTVLLFEAGHERVAIVMNLVQLGAFSAIAVHNARIAKPR